MPAVGQGQHKLRLRQATAGDLAIRSRYFRSKMSLLSGSHPQNITLATPMSCPISNFAKGSNDKIFFGMIHATRSCFRVVPGQLDLLHCISRVSEGSELTALHRLGHAKVIAPVQVNMLVHQW